MSLLRWLSLLSLVVIFSVPIHSQSTLAAAATLVEQAAEALDNDDLTTAQSLAVGANALITEDLITTCPALAGAQALLSQVSAAENIEGADALIDSVHTLITSCDADLAQDDEAPDEESEPQGILLPQGGAPQSGSATGSNSQNGNNQSGNTQNSTTQNSTIPSTASVTGLASEVITVQNADLVEELLTLGNGSISGAVWSHDGQRIAVGGAAGLFIFDANDLTEPIQTLRGYGPVLQLMFSPDDQFLLGRNYSEGSLIVYDLNSGTERVRHEVLGLFITLSPDGRFLVYATAESTYKGLRFLIDWHTTSPTIVDYSFDQGTISRINISPDSQTVVVALNQQDTSMLTFQLFDTGFLFDSSITPNPDMFPWIYEDRTASSAEFVSNHEMIYYLGHFSDIEILRFNFQTGDQDLVGRLDDVPTYWILDVQQGYAVLSGSKALEEPMLNYNDIDGVGWTIARAVNSADISPDGTELVGITYNGDLERISTEDGMILEVASPYTCDSKALSWSPNSDSIAISCIGQRALVWSLGEPDQPAVFGNPRSNLTPDNLVWMNADEVLWLGTNGGEIWNPETGALTRTLPEITSHEDNLFALSPDGQRVVVEGGYWTHAAHIYDMASGQVLHILEPPGRRFRQLIGWSSTGEILTVGHATDEVEAEMYQIQVWDGETGQTVSEYSIDGSYHSGFAIAPDGKTYASIVNNQIVIYDLMSGSVVSAIDLPPGGARKLVYSNDGRILAYAYSARGSGVIDLYDVEMGQFLAQLTGHLSIVDLAISPDGTMLASTGGDGTTRIWGISPR
ncbi:MAG: hypothetical protein CL607_00420 [Anaerolineaceae bacterium]|nr:hypothetical protein [Anaerolineaceae bacterium]